MFRMLLACGFVFAMTGSDQSPGALTADQKAAGWKLLFNGTSLAGWRSYNTEAVPAGWRAAGGELVRDGDGGDLMTVEEFGDFELALEWKVSKNGNSGVMFRVTKGDKYPWHSGPEFQVLDNAIHKDGKNPLTSAGSNYAVHPPVKDVTRPVGEWNDIRLIASGTHVEHWMNGVKLLEYEIGSPDWTARVKASKFGVIPPYARSQRGHIVLQDHGDLVSYRHLKVRVL